MVPTVVRHREAERLALLLRFSENGVYGIVVLDGGVIDRWHVVDFVIERPNSEFPVGPGGPYRFSRVQAEGE